MLLLSWSLYILLQLLAFGPPRASALGNASAPFTSTTPQPSSLSDGAKPASTLPCEASGMCSLGKVQPFTGDVWPSAALASCLAARAFRRELVLLTESRLAPAYQTFANLLDVGYEHVVLLSLPGPCNRSATAWPRLSCVWSSQLITGNTKYLMDRVSFLARAVRLGYNVLMLDSDVLLFGDVYGSLKAPPLGNATLLAMRDGNGWLNCGVVYVQNARPDGPTAYMLAEIVDRTERWAGDPGFVWSRGHPTTCWDQTVYSDTLLSAVSGRPMAPLCWIKGEGEPVRQWEAAHLAALGVAQPSPEGFLVPQAYMTSVEVAVPEEQVEAAPDFAATLPRHTLTAELRVPHANGTWPDGLGGPLYAPQRSPTAQAFIDRLKEDVLPLWPDPEDPAHAQAAAAAPRERFAFLPLWLSQSWSNGGRLGHWHPGLARRHPATGRPMHPSLLAHFVHVPGGASNKLTVKMAYGHWRWDVAHRAHPARGVFFASTRHVPLPDALALAPQLEAREWASEREFADAAMALVRLALEMGRAAALPAPRCNVSWLGGEANSRLPLAIRDGFYIPYAPRHEGFSNLRCLWGGYLPYGCQAVRWYYPGGLLAPEYDHYLELIRQDEHGTHGSSSSGTAAHAPSDGVMSATASSTQASSSGGLATSNTAVGVGGPGNGSSTAPQVITVPRELLEPPGGPNGTWDVAVLADKLMKMYGGPGSGLLQPRVQLHDPGAGHGEHEGEGQGHSHAHGDGHGHGSRGGHGEPCKGEGGRCTSLGPRVLVLPEVPRLSGALGPRHQDYRTHAHGDHDKASCEWVESGRYRRRGRRASRV